MLQHIKTAHTVQSNMNTYMFSVINRKELLLGLAIIFSSSLVVKSAQAQYLTVSNFQSIDVPGASQTLAYAISGKTEVGQYTQNGVTYGFAETGSSITTLNHSTDRTPANTYLRGVYVDPDSGSTTLLGGYYTKDGLSHGFSQSEGVYTAINDPKGVSTYVFGKSGDTTIGYYNLANGTSIGFTLAGGNFTDVIDPNAGSHTYLRSIDGSTIVGDYTDKNNVSHAFSETAGLFTDINLPPGVQSSSARGVSGNIVAGYYTDINGITQGFLEMGSTFIPVIDPAGGLGSRTYVTGLSDQKIVGYYTTATGVSHSFTADISVAPGAPAPPLTACIAFAGVLLLQAFRRKAA